MSGGSTVFFRCQCSSHLSGVANVSERKGFVMPILSPDDLRMFAEQGYLHVPGVVPEEKCEAVIAALFEFLGMDRTCPEDWYRAPLKPGGMVELYQHQTLWDTRQEPRVHQLFAELLGTEALWVTIDRAGFKPPRHPEHPEYDHKGFIHWDVDTSKLPVRFGVQGVLYLSVPPPTREASNVFRGFIAIWRSGLRPSPRIVTPMLRI